MTIPLVVLSVVLAFGAGAVIGEIDAKKRADLRWTAQTEKARAEAVAAARGIETQRYRNMEVAYRANQLDKDRLRGDVVRANDAARGLRDDVAAVRRSLPADTGQAGLVALDTCGVLFGACVDEYRAVAEAADEHASDAKLCNAGWPVK